MKNNILIVLVVFSLLLTFIAWVYPTYFFKISFDIEIDILANNGFLARWRPTDFELLLIHSFNAFVTLGLLFNLKIFRILFVLMILVNYVPLPFLGYSISPPEEAFLGAGITLIDGMILMLIFSTEPE